MPEQYQPSGTSAAAIAQGVESAIAAGALAPGEALPSVRRLAAACGVSPGTAAAALAELRRRGLVTSEPRRGVRVAPRPAGAARLAVPLPPGTRDLAAGNPDPALLPDLGRALARLTPSRRLYGEPAVLPALARRARAHLADAGLADATDGDAPLAIVAGALDGVERALAATLRPGDRVGVEDPGYSALLDLVRGLGLIPEPMALDRFGVLPAALAGALAAGVRAVVLTPRGQNPTGAAFDCTRAHDLRALLAAGPPILAIEDDHLGAVAGAAHLPVAPAAARWVIARSTSKALGPDLRCALLTGDPETVERIARRHQLGPGWVSHIVQALVADLLGDRAVTRLVTRAAHVYAERRAALIEALAERGIEGVGASGLNVWVPVGEESAVVAGLLQRGWAVSPGAPFRLHAPPAIRITTAALEPADAARVAGDLRGVLSGSAVRAA